MTLNKITAVIAGRVGKELDLQYRQWLVPQVEAWRSRLIRNTLSKNPMERTQFVQSILIPLTYGTIECGGLACTGSYSEVLPGLLRIGPTPFDYLGSTDGSSALRFNDPGTAPYLQIGKIASKFPAYEMINNQVFIPGHSIKEVKGVGIFDEPSIVMQWQCTKNQENCDWWNAEYPISGDILAMAKTAIWEELGLPKETLPQTLKQEE